MKISAKIDFISEPMVSHMPYGREDYTFMELLCIHQNRDNTGHDDDHLWFRLSGREMEKFLKGDFKKGDQVILDVWMCSGDEYPFNYTKMELKNIIKSFC